jgi:hypothetical protein
MDMSFHEFLRYTKTHISNIQKIILSVIPFIPKVLDSTTVPIFLCLVFLKVMHVLCTLIIFCNFLLEVYINL